MKESDETILTIGGGRGKTRDGLRLARAMLPLPATTNTPKDVVQTRESCKAIERADTAGLERMGGVTYIKWLRVEVDRITLADDDDTGRDLILTGRRLWDRLAKDRHVAEKATVELYEACKVLALSLMAAGLRSPKYKERNDMEKRNVALNFTSVSHACVNNGLADMARDCMDGAQALARLCSAPRGQEVYLALHLASLHVELSAGDADRALASMTEIASRVTSADGDDTHKGLDVLKKAFMLCKGSLGKAASCTDAARMRVAAKVFALVHEASAALLERSSQATAVNGDFRELMHSSLEMEALVLSDMVADEDHARALHLCAQLPEDKQAGSRIGFVVTKLLFKQGRKTDARHRALEMARENAEGDFELCLHLSRLLAAHGEHCAGVEVVNRLMAVRQHQREPERWSVLVVDKFVALIDGMDRIDDALAHLDEVLAEHHKDKCTVTDAVVQTVHSCLLSTFRTHFERGEDFALAARLAAKAIEWTTPDMGASRVAALRMAAWANVKLKDGPAAYGLAARALAEEGRNNPKTLYLAILAAVLCDDTARPPNDDTNRHVDDLLAATSYDAECLQVLHDAALEHGRRDVALRVHLRWLERAPSTALASCLVACVRHMCALRLPAAWTSGELDAAHVADACTYFQAAAARLPTLAAGEPPGSEEDLWWATKIAWNLACRARVLGLHEATVQLAEVALDYCRLVAFDLCQMAHTAACSISAGVACLVCLDGADVAADVRRRSLMGLRALNHLSNGAEAVDKVLSNADQPSLHGSFFSQPGLRDDLQALVLEAMARAASYDRGQEATLLPQLRAKLGEAHLGGRHLLHLAAVASDLESLKTAMASVTATTYRLAFNALVRGEGPAAPDAAEWVLNLARCVVGALERSSDADACLDDDLRGMVQRLLQFGGDEGQEQPTCWVDVLAWVGHKAEAIASYASRVRKVKLAEKWMVEALQARGAQATLTQDDADLSRVRRAYDALLQRANQPQDALAGGVGLCYHA